jgi:tRNA nucleotidyltransferase (CCA-adding enzyme)
MEVITTHVNADFDAMGSMIAAKKLYPEALLVFPGSQEQTLREFFVTSTVYIYDFKRLRDLDLSEVHRLILVDTRQVSRIGRFHEIVGRPGLEIHIYDHHPDAEDDVHGEVEIIKPLGATVTVLTQIIRERGLTLAPEEATVLALGLFEDTGSFTFNSTTPEDFEAAAFLRQCGADLNVVADMLTRELTAEQVSLLSELIHSARTYTIQGIDVCIATVSVDRYVGDFAVLVHKLKDMENLDVVFALARMEDRIYLVARSRVPEVNVATIAGFFDGGGHATAASATIRDLTLNQAEDKLFEVLQSVIKPTPLARDLMSSPVIHVDTTASVGEAAQVMTRYNINAMPVVEGGVVVGAVTRQVLEKAIFHGLEKQPIDEYMNRDVHTVPPTATLLDIQKFLVEYQQRILAVVADSRLVGVVTRRDLLNYLVSDSSNTPRALYDDLPIMTAARRKNLSSLLAEQLPREIIELLRNVGELAAEMGYQSYAVGGCIRDLLMRRSNFDIDIVVEGDGIEFAKVFAERHHIRARCHKKFNTAVLVFPDGRKMDVATARMEYYQYPAALPVVEFGSLKMDLYRRDFTVNTLAVALNPDSFGQLIDFFGGQRDIKEKVIRVLHNLSFVEDPTRILRAIRFEQRFGFRIGKQTAGQIRNAIKMSLLEKMGGHRLFHEIQHILVEADPLASIRRLAEFAVLPVLSPEIRLNQQLEALFVQLKEIVTWYRLSFLSEPLEVWWVYLLGLAARLRRESARDFCERLELPEHLRNRLLWALRHSEELLEGFFQLREIRPSDIYRALQPFKVEELLFMMARTQREEVRRMISHYFHKYRDMRTELKGRDLQVLGLEPGPLYRRILDELLDARLNGKLMSRQDEIDYVLRHFAASGQPLRVSTAKGAGG